MTDPVLHDHAPSTASFLDAVLDGLRRTPKSLPCKFFYDETGALLFETICTLDEYYPTRTELAIMMRHAPDMARELGPRARLVEPGSGSLQKARFLLEYMDDPVAFVPIDIAREQLEEAARVLAQDYPELVVQAVCADFTRDLTVPPAPPDTGGTVVYYPGSTIGNFPPDEAIAFLARLARLAGDRGAVLIGVDLKKDTDVLIRAYDDPTGVTAAFNKNLLARINRELDADFDLASFGHRASYEERPSRVVIELVSTRWQSVRVAGETFEFEPGEAIVTEYSHKPSLEDFAELAAAAGLGVERVWTDERGWFSVQLLRPR